MQNEELTVITKEETITNSEITNIKSAEDVDDFCNVVFYLSSYIQNENLDIFYDKNFKCRKDTKLTCHEQTKLHMQLITDKLAEIYFVIHNDKYSNRKFIIKYNTTVFKVYFDSKSKRALFGFEEKLYRVIQKAKLEVLRNICLKGSYISNIEWISNMFRESLEYISLEDNYIYNIRTLKKILKNPKKTTLAINLLGNPLSKITQFVSWDDEKFIKNHKCKILDHILNYNNNINAYSNSYYNYHTYYDYNNSRYKGFYSDDSSDDSDCYCCNPISFRRITQENPENPQHKYRLFLSYYNKIGARMSI